MGDKIGDKKTNLYEGRFSYNDIADNNKDIWVYI